MKYLTDKQLKKLTPQRRLALLRRVQAMVGQQIDEWFDFMPEQLSESETELNEYRKRIHKLVDNDKQNVS